MMAGKAKNTLNCLFLLPALLSLLLFCRPALADQAEIDHVNGQIRNRGAQWWAAETSVSALPPEQRQKRLGLVKRAAPASALNSTQLLAAEAPPLAALPLSLNYANYNYVTPVRNQLNCGSCWAFATAAALESQIAMDTGSLVNLSEQVLVSCSGAGNCSGGYIEDASDFLKFTGIPVEECFPYTHTNNSCSNAVCPLWQNDTYGITGWHWVALGTASVNTIKNALYTYGPLVVSMDVYSDFYSYSGGVYSYVTGNYLGGHAIELIGYDDVFQCFIVKNSWGTGWGESGFFRIAYSQVNGAVEFGQYSIAYHGYKDNTPACSYDLSPTGSTIGLAGGTLTVYVTAPLGCSWTAASNASWITVASGANGSGNGQVSLSIPSLTDSTRSGTVTIAGKTYTVTQKKLTAEGSGYGILLW